jgi:hypothetical protein
MKGFFFFEPCRRYPLRRFTRQPRLPSERQGRASGICSKPRQCRRAAVEIVGFRPSGASDLGRSAIPPACCGSALS